MKTRAGFTLVEMIVYIALLTLLMSGTVLTAYNLLTDANGTRTKVNTDEEANFLLRKIDWALVGATNATVTDPPAGTVSSILQTTKAGTSLQIALNIASSSMQMKEGANPALPLSSTNVKVENLNFDRTTAGIVRTTFTLNGRSFELVQNLLP